MTHHDINVIACIHGALYAANMLDENDRDTKHASHTFAKLALAMKEAFRIGYQLGVSEEEELFLDYALDQYYGAFPDVPKVEWFIQTRMRWLETDAFAFFSGRSGSERIA